MSVYKRPGAKTYSYDFELGGDRFSGSTSETDKRKALAAEERARAVARVTIAQRAEFRGKEMTFSVAASRYWAEVGQHHKNSATTWWSMGWLTQAIGKNTPMADITDNLVAELVAKRRAENKPSNRKKLPKPAPVLVGPATVNRTVTEPLRKIMTRAAKVWKVRTGDVTWKQHMLSEPRERIREATHAEEKRIMEKIGRGYDDALAFAFLSGCRRMEVVGLTWQKIDFGNKQFTVLGKGDKLRSIPLTKRLFEIVWRQQGNHAERVFTYVAARTDKRKGIERGVRYPVTDAGLRTAARRAIDAAGVKDFRFHDTRHTMATRTLRTSNMKVVQNMLGHERITTTERYAHAMVEDVRKGMEAASPTESPTTADVEPVNVLRENEI
jgi:integrase